MVNILNSVRKAARDSSSVDADGVCLHIIMFKCVYFYLLLPQELPDHYIKLNMEVTVVV